MNWKETMKHNANSEIAISLITRIPLGTASVFLRAWVIDAILWRHFVEPTFATPSPGLLGVFGLILCVRAFSAVGRTPPELPEELMSDHDFAVSQALRVQEACNYA